MTETQDELSQPAGERAVKEAITECWGERCAQFHPLCPTCLAWQFYDDALAKAGGA